MYCSKCGKQIPDGSLFCSFCGYKIETGQVVTSYQPSQLITQTPPITIQQTVWSRDRLIKEMDDLKTVMVLFMILGIVFGILGLIISIVVVSTTPLYIFCLIGAILLIILIPSALKYEELKKKL